MDMIQELVTYLDSQSITEDNIGQIRRACFVPWDSEWNAIVRVETGRVEAATREIKEQPKQAGGMTPL